MSGYWLAIKGTNCKNLWYTYLNNLEKNEKNLAHVVVSSHNGLSSFGYLNLLVFLDFFTSNNAHVVLTGIPFRVSKDLGV